LALSLDQKTTGMPLPSMTFVGATTNCVSGKIANCLVIAKS